LIYYLLLKSFFPEILFYNYILMALITECNNKKFGLIINEKDNNVKENKIIYYIIVNFTEYIDNIKKLNIINFTNLLLQFIKYYIRFKIKDNNFSIDEINNFNIELKIFSEKQNYYYLYLNDNKFYDITLKYIKLIKLKTFEIF